MLEMLSKMCLRDLATKIERIKIETLVTIQVHQNDISKELRAKEASDFNW